MIQTKDYSIENFRKISMSLSVAHDCLLNGSRVVIPSSLQPQVLTSFGTFWYPKNETVNPYSSILARN